MVLNNQGYHLDVDVGCYMSGKRMGQAEREEEFRAEMIEQECRTRRKLERIRDDEEYD
jgi:hypothetical protein